MWCQRKMGRTGAKWAQNKRSEQDYLICLPHLRAGSMLAKNVEVDWQKMVLSLKFRPDFPSHPLWQQPPASSIKPSIVNCVFPGAFVTFLIQQMYPVYWFYVYYLPSLLSFSALRMNILVQISQWCKRISVEVSETLRNWFLKLQGKEIKSVS